MKVILLMAITLDGRIAKDSKHFPDWTGKEDKKFFMTRTKEAGVIIMGSKTYDTIGKPLPNRKNIILTRDENKKSNQKNLVFTSEEPQKILQNLEKEGFKEVILVGGTQINTLFAKKKLIDEIIVTTSSIIFGSGLGLFDESISLKLELQKIKNLDKNTIISYYKVIK